MRHDDPTPDPERHIPPIFDDDERLRRMIQDGYVFTPLWALFSSSTVTDQHDLVRWIVVAAAMLDIANIRQLGAGYGPDAFAELAHNAWRKVDELRAAAYESKEKQRERIAHTVNADMAAIIERQLGLDQAKPKD